MPLSEATLARLREQSPFKKGNRLQVKPDDPKRWLAEGLSAIEIINRGAPLMAAFLLRVGLAQVKPHYARIDAAKFLLQQHLAQLRAEGLIDESGKRIISYRRLIILAEEFMAQGGQPPASILTVVPASAPVVEGVVVDDLQGSSGGAGYAEAGQAAPPASAPNYKERHRLARTEEYHRLHPEAKRLPPRPPGVKRRTKAEMERMP